jgi:hypothetical protein
MYNVLIGTPERSRTAYDAMEGDRTGHHRYSLRGGNRRRDLVDQNSRETELNTHQSGVSMLLGRKELRHMEE